MAQLIRVGPLTTMEDIFNFIVLAERLKTTLRHSWTSDVSRQESVAEHSWMICLIALIVMERVELQLDKLKVLKMLILHDLAESITGDIPLAHQNENFNHVAKVESERIAMEKLCESLPLDIKNDLIQIWEEYEQRISSEARLAKAIDVLEACMQHWIADIATWDQGDFDVCAYIKDELFEIDPFLKEFKGYIDTKTVAKIIEAKEESRLNPIKLKRYHQSLER